MAGGAELDGKKRTIKACDRCRLKKVKCDGTTPCARCRQDDSICQFNVRSSSDGKSVSAAHVNQLQAHNDILVRTLKAVWEQYALPQQDVVERARTWSVHDIVRHAGILDDSNLDRMAEDLDVASVDHSASTSRNNSTRDADATMAVIDGKSTFSERPQTHEPHSDLDLDFASDTYATNLDFSAWSDLHSQFSQPASATNDSTPTLTGTSEPRASIATAQPMSGIYRANRPKNPVPMPPPLHPHVPSHLQMLHQQQQQQPQAQSFQSPYQTFSSSNLAFVDYGGYGMDDMNTYGDQWSSNVEGNLQSQDQQNQQNRHGSNYPH